MARRRRRKPRYKKPKQKVEFSKKIWMLLFFMALGVNIYAMYAMFIIQDLSALPTLILSIFGEFTAATGFYYNKAKKENEIKLLKLYGEDIMREVNKDED